MSSYNPITSTHVHSYDEVDSYLRTRKGRMLFSRKVANNTYLQRMEKGIALLLHKTYVLIWHRNDTVTLNSGEWYTMTTKNRMNLWLPDTYEVRDGKYTTNERFVQVVSIKGYWAVEFTRQEFHYNSPRKLDDPTQCVWFHDGMTVDLATMTEFTAATDTTNTFRHNDEIEKLLTRYIRGMPHDAEDWPMYVYEAEDSYGGEHHTAADVYTPELLVQMMRERLYSRHLAFAARGARYGDWDRATMWFDFVFETDRRAATGHIRSLVAPDIRAFIRSRCLQGAHNKGTRRDRRGVA